ncbi:MAG: rhodanese-like domain-containing protein, partial [Sphaerospermopsis kisseleviana]
YCQSGNRSNKAAQKLIQAGFTDFSQLQGGMTAWKQSGYPTKVNKNAPISLMRQVQIVAGTLVFTGTILGAFVSPWFLILSGFVGAGLVFAGVTNTCAMGVLLAKLPYNQRG